MKRSIGICIALAFLSGCATPTEKSDSPRVYSGYKGQSINVIINYAAKGNTDIQARSILRYMKRHVPGNPQFQIRHVWGAGGIVGANFLGEATEPDGYTMGVFTAPIWAQVMKDPALRVDFRDFQMVGSVSGQTITYVRKNAIPGGLKSYKDLLFTKHTIRTAGHGPSSSKDIRIRLFLDVLKIPYHHVTGYRSAGRIRAAILKNEVDFTSDSLLSYMARVKPQLIETGNSIPAWHIGHLTPDGDMKCSSTVPKEIPCFVQVYEEKFGHGKRPKKLYWDALRIIAGTREILRIIVFPKGTPKNAVNTMRAAWAKTMKDPAFLEEFRRLNASPFVGMEGKDAQTYLKNILPVPPKLQRFLLDYAAAASN